jgi:GH35 family endo-1,4-beta-xylanase
VNQNRLFAPFNPLKKIDQPAILALNSLRSINERISVTMQFDQPSSAGCCRTSVLIAPVALLLICLTINAQTGISILSDNLYDFSGAAGANANVTPVYVAGQPFTQAYRITVNGTSANIRDAGLWWRTTQPVSQGDNLQLTFWVRKVTPIDGNIIRGFVGFEKADQPYAQSLFTVFPCDSGAWTKYIIPFKAAGNYAVGEAQLTFQFAHGPQEFEIGGIGLINLGPAPPPPSSNVSVLPADVYQSFYFYIDQSVGGSVRTISVADQSFTQAVQISHNGDSEFVYRSGVGWRNAAAIAKGDVMLLSFRARKLEPAGSAVIRAQVVFERNGGNFEKSLSTNFPADSGEWKLYQLPFKSSADFAIGQAQLVFQFAYGPQKFEIGDVSLVNYGQNVSPKQLPSSFYYPGRGDVNAAWRIDANKRIDQHRKGNLTVIVRDRDGNPLPNAKVYVQQTNHAFKFGSAVTAQLLTGSGQTAADHEIYRSRVSSHFTTTVLENDLKWPFWENWAPWNRQPTLNALSWLRDNNLTVRGHNLIWPGADNMPGDTRNLNAEALRARIDDHFADILKHENAGGKCYQWDVINEPYSNFDVQGRIGTDGVRQTDGRLGNLEMVRWFQNARRLDPQAKLFVNDYDIIAAGGDDRRHQDYLFALSMWLLENGTPLDAVGLQGHFSRITPPATMEAIITRFSQLPVTLAVTEFDVNVGDEELQADYTRDVMTMIFSHPKFTDFLMWGFWEKAHWLPAGAMYRADWSSKPNALVYNDLVFKDWWTNETGATDSTGRLTVRGFKGHYNLTAIYQRASQTLTATLGDANEISITLDASAPRPPIRRDVKRQIDH